MNVAVKVLIGLLIFILSFFIRYASFLDTGYLPTRPALTYQSLGTDNDLDYQFYCAREYATDSIGMEQALLHYDYFFLCPLMSLVVANVSFTSSFVVMSIIIIILGSLVVVTPYALFSYIKKYEIGGLIASLTLLSNSTMIYNSDGRFFIYPLVTFFFALFSFIFCMVLYKRSLGWIVALGTMAFVQGLSKPFLYINDILLLSLLPFIFSYKSVEFFKNFPYIKISFDLQDFKKAVLAPLIYFCGLIGYELLHYLVTSRPFFLSDLFLPIGPSLKDEVLGTSLHFEGTSEQKIKNILLLFFVALKTLLSYIPGSLYLLIIGISALLLKSRNSIYSFIVTLVSVSVITLFLYFLVESFLFPNIYVVVEKYSVLELIHFALFIWFLGMVSRTQKGLALVFLHLPYLAALAMTLSAVAQAQLFVTLIFWFLLLIAYSLNLSWSRVLEQMAPRIHIIFSIIICLVFSSSIYNSYHNSLEKIKKNELEKKYLSWVQEQIPSEGIILGGIDDNLPLMSTYTQRVIIYNSHYQAYLIPVEGMSNTVIQLDTTADFISKAFTNSENVVFYILDNNSTAWNEYLQKGGSVNFPAGMYRIQEVAYNFDLQRGLFVLEQSN